MSHPKRKATDIRNVLLSRSVPMCRDGRTVNQAFDSLIVDALYLDLSSSEGNVNELTILFTIH